MNDRDRLLAIISLRFTRREPGHRPPDGATDPCSRSFQVAMGRGTVWRRLLLLLIAVVGCPTQAWGPPPAPFSGSSGGSWLSLAVDHHVGLVTSDHWTGTSASRRRRTAATATTTTTMTASATRRGRHRIPPSCTTTRIFSSSSSFSWDPAEQNVSSPVRGNENPTFTRREAPPISSSPQTPPPGTWTPVPPRRTSSSSSSSDPVSWQQRRQESLNMGHDPLLSLNLNLDALARAQAPERAQELYQRIAALYQLGYYDTAPDVVSFNSVLKAWAASTDPAQALEFWEQATSSRDLIPGSSGALDPDQGDELKIQPNVRSYNTFLWALAQRGLYAPAETLLHSLQEEAAWLPDRITYNTVLLAYANSPDPSAPARAEQLLRHMMTGTEDTHPPSLEEDPPLDESDSEILDEGEREAGIPRRSVTQVPTPDRISFNTVLSAWAQQGTVAAARRSEALLREMTNFVRPSSDAQRPSSHPGPPRVTPDVYSYTAVIQAWAAVGETDRAWALWQEMPLAQPYPIVPNRITYTAILQSLCLNQRLTEAEALLEDMWQQGEANLTVRPDCIAVSVLLDGWAQVAERQPTPALEAVRRWMQRMKQYSESWPEMAPTARTYTSALAALARSRQSHAPAWAEQMVFRDMAEMGLVPTVIHYNAVLDAYAKSPLADKALHGRRIWQLMRDKAGPDAAVVPDIITYNTLLACAAGAFGSAELKRQSLQLALEVFQVVQQRFQQELPQNPHVSGVEDNELESASNGEGESGFRPTAVTYHYLFKALRKFLPYATPGQQAYTSSSAKVPSETTTSEQHHQRQDDLIRKIFTLCCQQGCLNDMVLQQVLERTVRDQEQARALLGPHWRPGSLDVSQLPPSWSRYASRSSSKLSSPFSRSPSPSSTAPLSR